MIRSETHWGTIPAGARPCEAPEMSRVYQMALAPRDVRKLDGDECGTQIWCTGGVLWITQDGDPADYVLLPGERFTVTRPGPVVMQGMRDC